MTEWKECKLGDISRYINRGVSPSYVEKEGIVILNQKCIRNGRLNFNLARFTSKDKKYSNDKRLIKNDVLINSTGVGTAGRVSRFLNEFENCYVDTHVSIVRINESLAFPSFIFFNLNSREEEIENYAEGSTGQIELGRDRLKDIEILLPTYPEQIQIASILSSLDDKIDLLHRQNKTLEQLAETLFKQRFVEEGEKKNTKLGAVVKTSSGGTPSRSKMEYYSNGSIKWVKSKELKGTFIFDTEETITDVALKKSSAKLFPANTILIAMYGATVGEYAILAEPATCNQAICALIPNDNYPYTFLFIYIKLNKETFINMAVGSAQQNISQELIQELEITDSKDKIAKFHTEVEPMFQKIKSNTAQIKILTKLRDVLLPKLMSGEVSINC